MRRPQAAAYSLAIDHCPFGEHHSMATQKQVAIVGGGPAGLSAALWLHNLGIQPLLIESNDRIGGLQHLNFLGNNWVLGHLEQTGPQLATRFASHITGLGIKTLTGTTITGISFESDHLGLLLTDRSGKTAHLSAVAAIVATGTRFRAEEVFTDVEGFTSIDTQRILYGPYAFVAPERCVNARILIIGGSDNAYENARLLAPAAGIIHLAIRSRPKAQQSLVDAIESEVNRNRCQVWYPAWVRRVADNNGEIVVGVQTMNGIKSLAVDWIHVLAGYQPNSDFLKHCLPPTQANCLKYDAQGYLKVDTSGRTDLQRFYAAGDICSPNFPSVVNAIAQGAIAAKTIEFDLRSY